jgi:Glycosyl transferase 4-like domain
MFGYTNSITGPQQYLLENGSAVRPARAGIPPQSAETVFRICVMTAGHLSTCPRMLKAAESFHRAGYEVRVVSTNFEPWATDADRQIRAIRTLNWEVLDYSRATGNSLRVRSGLRFRGARALAKLVGPERLPFPVLGRATTRVFPELVSLAAAQPVDLVYGGGGGLAATMASGRRLGVPFAVDLEDLHSGENRGTPEGKFSGALAASVERAVFREAAFLTSGSDSIAGAYRKKYGKRPVVLNNTFTLPQREPDFAPRNGAPLRLYWFSQTIGPGRGLEQCVQAAGLAGVDCELHLRGKALGGYLAQLREQGAAAAPRLKIVPHDPEAPDRMVELCHGMDIGLALEPGTGENNRLALSNKAFTYILAGLAVAFTDTPGQHPLATDLGAGGLLFAPGDIKTFAAGIKAWAEDDTRLLAAKRAAWAAARRRWHWNHPEEEGALLAEVRKVLAQ